MFLKAKTMSDDIYPIYYNNFGIAFKWKRAMGGRGFNKIQVVFRDMGLYLTLDDLKLFEKQILHSKQCKSCEKCKKDGVARHILLRTPSDKIDIAVSSDELNDIDDLIRGTLFQLHLDEYISELCTT